MDCDELKKLSLFVNNDCRQRINMYFSKPVLKYNSADCIFNEIKNYFKHYKVREYEFKDFCNIDLDLLEQFCELVITSSLHIEWSTPAVINSDMRDVLFRKMYNAGCRKIVFDAVSLSDELLGKMKLEFNTEDILSLLKSVKQSGIKAGINFILGFPLETDDDYAESLEFLTKNQLFINEITKISYCLGNYLKKECYPSPLCKYWQDCMNSHNDMEALKRDPKTYLDDILKIGIPVINIEPNLHILDRFKKIVNNYSLKQKDLRFIFDNGKGRLFWKNRELTKGLGLYTSIFSSGFWRDSEHADWQIRKINETKMILEGKWQTLPITQMWEIELLKDVTFNWKITMEVLEELVIEGEQQTNIMLTELYGNWLSEDGFSGKYNSYFNNDWITLFNKEIDIVKSVKAINCSGGLPSVLLKCNNRDSGCYLSVLNTSSIFGAHKLKYYRINENGKKYTPGKYLYFDGEIEINS